MTEITKEEWLNWKQDKVTREFLKRVNDRREFLKEGIAEGQAAREELDTMIGRCQGIRDIVEYAVHEFEVIDLTEESDENAN